MISHSGLLIRPHMDMLDHQHNRVLPFRSMYETDYSDVGRDVVVANAVIIKAHSGALHRKQVAAALTLVYLVAAKMSSNFFLRVCPSASGQLESSWWTKMTFSRMACACRKAVKQELAHARHR